MISVKVTDEYVNLRIDKFLCKKFDISFAHSQKLIREKKVKINHVKADIATKILAYDLIEIYSSLNLRKNIISPTKKLNQAKIEKLHDKFWQYKIFEDDNLVVINKPSGLPSQGGTAVEYSVDDFVRKYQYHLVHRIDKDTSGILLIAKNKICADFLLKSFKEKTITKTYIALVVGRVKNSVGTINMPLLKKQLGKNEKVQVDIEFGKQAITHYKVIKHHQNYSELELNPVTGRTHQIRVHCKEIGHPILNDFKYGKLKADFKKLFPRLCLHAFKVEIKDYFGSDLIIQTPYPNFTLN